MPPVLVDSNVILDVVTEDAEWLDWSADALERCAESGRLVINPIVYAEVAIGFTAIEELDDALPREYFTREGLPWEAAFLAGQAFLHKGAEAAKIGLVDGETGHRGVTAALGQYGLIGR